MKTYMTSTSMLSVFLEELILIVLHSSLTPLQKQGLQSIFKTLYIRFPDSSLAKIPTAIGSASGMVFGVIHCLGWNFFPGHTEQIFWRVASIGVPCSLIVPFLGAAVFLSHDHVTDLQHAFEPLMGCVTCCIFLYLFARFTIIVLMFLSLRSLPPGAYHTVVWSEFIPHL
ncbi:hypothetical protein BDR07DRAFT_1533932, partial [Suillus spraguei]